MQTLPFSVCPVVAQTGRAAPEALCYLNAPSGFSEVICRRRTRRLRSLSGVACGFGADVEGATVALRAISVSSPGEESTLEGLCRAGLPADLPGEGLWEGNLGTSALVEAEK